MIGVLVISLLDSSLLGICTGIMDIGHTQMWNETDNNTLEQKQNPKREIFN